MIILLAIILLVVIAAGWVIGKYNRLNTMKVDVSKAWSQVENQYQRRFELIPNLVNTVKGAANFEAKTLTDVTEARAKVGQMQITPETLSDPQALKNFQSAQDGLSSALSRLMVVVERYPELKAVKGFQDLQVQLEGTENRIATERGRFNDAVQTFNRYLVIFPNNVIAGMFGFKEMPFFGATTGADTAPVVDFES